MALLLIQVPKNRIITLLEKKVGKSLHLYKFLGGKTSGPESYSADIGKALENCKKPTVIEFQ